MLKIPTTLSPPIVLPIPEDPDGAHESVAQMQRAVLSEIRTMRCQLEQLGHVLWKPHGNGGQSPSTEHVLTVFREETASLRVLLQQQSDTIVRALGKLQCDYINLPVGPSDLQIQSNGVEDATMGGLYSSAGTADGQNESKEQGGNTQSIELTASEKIVRPKRVLQRQKSKYGKDFPSYFKRLVLSAQFDLFMGVVILINVCFMSVDLEWRGRYYAYVLGLLDDDADWPRAKIFFSIMEKCFSTLYVVELIIRIWALRRAFLHQKFHVFDAAIVLLGFIDCFILDALDSQLVNFSVLRVLRTIRCFRMAKVIMFGEHVSEMRVLVRTLLLSLRGICWSMLLIALIVLAAAILMMQLSMNVFEDDSVQLQQKQWLYAQFGTTSRATITLFECTFTTGWPKYVRPLLENINPAFALFWVPYIAFVNFAVMRVIAALFLKQTLAVAAIDEGRVAMEKMKQKESYAKILRNLFLEADSSGDGAISKDEFANMLKNNTVLKLFDDLDLEIEEVVALYSVVSADDGVADYDEFLAGALKLKSSVRTIDTIQILHAQQDMHKDVKQTFESLQGIVEALRIRDKNVQLTSSRVKGGLHYSA